MSFVDETIPYYDGFDYAVYAVLGGQRGVMASVKKVLVSPSCDWKIIMQSSAFQGWNGGYVSLYSVTGKELQRFTITTCCCGRMRRPFGAAESIGVTSMTTSPGLTRSAAIGRFASSGSALMMAALSSSIPWPVSAETAIPPFPH